VLKYSVTLFNVPQLITGDATHHITLNNNIYHQNQKYPETNVQELDVTDVLADEVD